MLVRKESYTLSPGKFGEKQDMYVVFSIDGWWGILSAVEKMDTWLSNQNEHHNWKEDAYKEDTLQSIVKIFLQRDIYKIGKRYKYCKEQQQNLNNQKLPQ